MTMLLIFLISFCCSVQSLPTIHLVPHSHCDPGYRESFEEYYKDYVHNVFDTMIEALNGDTRRKFVWEEVSFLSRWWQDASEKQKATVMRLVSSKQLEFIGGGWVMHDEAINNVFTIVNQMTLGLQYLNETLGVRPHYEWHIDPFGHSLMMPELYHALQYSAIVINRIPNQTKQKMKKSKSLEFYWKSSISNMSIFTHVLGEHYSAPTIIGLDVKEKAESFVNTSRKRLEWYRTDHLLVPFGNDFAFTDAVNDFKKIEDVMDYINNHSDTYQLVVQYSTLDDYFTAVLNSNVQFPEVIDEDFFPYIACYPCLSDQCDSIEGLFDSPCSLLISDAYWSGFYTSKPSQKLLIRKQEAVLFSLDVLNSFYPFQTLNIAEALKMSRNTSALLSHHDAITGTSFPPCYEDYNQRLFTAITLGQDAIGILKESIMCKSDTSLPRLNAEIKTSLNELTDDNIAVLVMFNPSSQARPMYVKLELPDGLCVQVFNISVEGETQTMSSQQIGSCLYVPVEFKQFEIKVLFLKKINCNTNSSFSTLKRSKPTRYSTQHLSDDSMSNTINNGVIQLDFDSHNHLALWRNLLTNKSFKLSLDFTQYLEIEGSKIIPLSVCDGSNVYTFVPDNGSKDLLDNNKLSRYVQTASGPLVWEIEQEINTEICPINVTLRLFKPIRNDDVYNDFFELQPHVGPLPSSQPNSISLSLLTDLITSNNFTTYTSGIYPMPRTYEKLHSIQENFYPLVGRVSIVDSVQKMGLTLAAQRPMAVTGSNGKIELLVHRRIPLWYDPRGNDSSIQDDVLFVGITPSDTVDMNSFNTMQYLQSPISLHVAILDSYKEWTSFCTMTWIPFTQLLPQSVHLLSIELLKQLPHGEILIGIRMISNDVETIDMSMLFTHWTIKQIDETTPDFGIKITSVTSTSVKLSPLKLASYSIILS